MQDLTELTDFVSLSAIERETGISRRTIGRMIADHGEDNVPHIALAKSRRYSRAAILEMLDARCTRPSTSEIAAGRISRVLRVPERQILEAISRGEIAGNLHGQSGTVTESVARLVVWAQKIHDERDNAK